MTQMKDAFLKAAKTTSPAHVIQRFIRAAKQTAPPVNRHGVRILKGYAK